MKMIISHKKANYNRTNTDLLPEINEKHCTPSSRQYKNKNKYFHLEILIFCDNFNIYKAEIEVQIVTCVIVLNMRICYTVGQRLKKGQHYAKGI